MLAPLVKRSLKWFRAAAEPSGQDPAWHRAAVGGMWHEIGSLQFEFLLDQGLKPADRFLDVGCGSLRGGIHFIGYLDRGHYYGIDINQDLLDAGRRELERHALVDKGPKLVQTATFDFKSLNQTFEFALAQSVFTHLALNSIMRCLINIEQVLAPGGRFYATFFENPAGKANLEPVQHRSAGPWDGLTYFDRDPYHYDFGTFRWICQETQLRAHYIGDWNHPNDQKMMVFVKLPED